jgi:DNA-directed RNA polymerase specialized sigma24 family protein
VERTIIGFDQDEMGDWRAILICGHRQHIRHNPPLVSRPWVLTEEGRSRFLGVALDCKACDEGEPVSDAMVLPDALEAIYTQFHTDLHRFILSRVSDPGTAEAILQYVYLMIHAHAGDRRESDRLANWLYEIVRNAIIDYGHALPEVNAPSGAAELAPAVRAFLACLPGNARQALIMTEYQGLGVREIAERLDISPAEAESRVRGGREMVREALSDWCHWAVERES